MTPVWVLRRSVWWDSGLEKTVESIYASRELAEKALAEWDKNEKGKLWIEEHDLVGTEEAEVEKLRKENAGYREVLTLLSKNNTGCSSLTNDAVVKLAVEALEGKFT